MYISLIICTLWHSIFILRKLSFSLCRFTSVLVKISNRIYIFEVSPQLSIFRRNERHLFLVIFWFVRRQVARNSTDERMEKKRYPSKVKAVIFSTGLYRSLMKTELRNENGRILSAIKASYVIKIIIYNAIK